MSKTKRRLLIVSDTAAWLVNGQVVAFEPVVREIEHFAALFDTIIWVAYRYPGLPHGNARVLSTETPLRLMALPAVGGISWLAKIRALFYAPWYGLVVGFALFQADVVHTRAPSLPAFWAILFSWVDRSRIYWHKYAGNWKEPNPPFFYGLQKYLLCKVKRAHVTINGKWPDQPPHCISFENPCLSDIEKEQAKANGLQKDFSGAIELCFVGGLTQSKGIIPFIQAVALLPAKEISQVWILGDGEQRVSAEELIHHTHLSSRIHLLGLQPRSVVERIYTRSHCLILPSATEGFPKVIAEAAAHGCIPIVSDVSAIGQYIHSGVNGMLLQKLEAASIAQTIMELLQKRADLKNMSLVAIQMAELFTYSRYVNRIQTEILQEECVR